MKIEELRTLYASLPQLGALTKVLKDGKTRHISLNGLVASAPALFFAAFAERWVGVHAQARGRIHFNDASNNTVTSAEVHWGMSGRHNVENAMVAVAAAVSLVGGLFMKGSNINYPAGTDFQVEVRDNVDLGVTPEELKDAMNPNIPHGQEIVIEVK